MSPQRRWKSPSSPARGTIGRQSHLDPTRPRSLPDLDPHPGRLSKVRGIIRPIIGPKLRYRLRSGGLLDNEIRAVRLDKVDDLD